MVFLNKLIPIYSSVASWSNFIHLKSFLKTETKINIFGLRCVWTNSSATTEKDGIPRRLPIWTFRKTRKPLFMYSRIDFNHYKLFSSDPNSSSEQIQKALDDKEFQNILKDFAKDFGVNEGTDEILENIRNDIEKDSMSDECLSSRTKETLGVYKSFFKERFKEFEDKDSEVIYSYEEELHLPDDFFHIDQEHDKKISKQEVKRGITGVFDIEELIPILRSEKCFDISVMKIPKHYHYVDYMVLATAKSLRHIKAVTEFILKFYKMKKSKEDPFIKIEGEKLGNWKAMDMGNIVLHVFLEDIRVIYDLESLWLLDQKYDIGGQVEDDDVMQILEEEMEFLNCLRSETNIETGKEIVK